MSREDIERVVDVWKGRLYLAHWQTTIAWDRPLDEGDAIGECDRYDSYDYATLRFAPSLFTSDRRKVNTTVVHELLHMSMRDLEWAACSVEKLLPKAVYTLFDARFEHEAEAMIDRLATILVELGGEV